MPKYIVNDVCDVVFRRLSDNKIVFTAEAQLASISQSITEEKIKGGIGNRTLSLVRSDKEVSLSVRNAVFDTDWLEMSQGVSFTNGTTTVFKKEENLVCATNQLTVTGTPKTGGVIKVIGADGTTYDGTFTTGKVSFTGGTNGALYSVIYQQDVTGKTLSLQSDKFSEKYSCEYRTVEYDIETNKIKADLYFVFNSVLPSGNMELSFENGKAQTPEVSFTCLTPTGSNEIGKIIEVPRAS